MSSIGKILIIVNFVLSLAFLGFASALVYKSGDYKQKYETETTTHKADIAESQKTAANDKATITTQQRELDVVRADKNRYFNEAESNRNALDQEKQINAQLRGDVDGIKANIDNFRATIQDLHTQLDNANKEKDRIRDAKEAAASAQEKAETQAKDATASMQKAVDEYNNLKEAADKAMKERDALDAKLKGLSSMTGVGLDLLQSQPQIDGEVVDANPPFFVLNVGTKDKVQVGHVIYFWKGSLYKGKGIVKEVTENSAAVEITSEVSGTTVSKGDKATTKL